MSNQNKGLLPVRTSVRLRQRNYSAPGAYFVTVLAYHRQPIFSEIQEAQVHLLDIGKIAQDEWLKTPLIRPYVSVDSELLVCMPDHVHGVIWILNEHGERILSAFADAETVCSPGYQPQSIGSIVSHIKAQVTRRVHSGEPPARPYKPVTTVSRRNSQWEPIRPLEEGRHRNRM